MKTARRTAIIVFGAALAVWLSAAVRGLGAKPTPSPESTPRRSADDAKETPRPLATRAPSSATKYSPRPRPTHASSSLSDDWTLSADQLAPPYGEEVSVEERAERDELRARSQDRIAELEQRWAADAASDGALQFTERIRNLAEEQGVAPGVLKNVECRATLCRVEVGLDDPSVIANLPRVAAQLGARYWMQRKPGERAALEVIVERDPQRAAL
jgi:hypothetical protein